MSFSDRVTVSVTAAGTSLNSTTTYSGSGRIGISEAIPPETTDLQIFVAIDVSALKYLALKCDQDVMLETNSASAPDDTIALEAGEVLLITPANVSDHLTADVVSLFVTNAGAAAASLQIVGLQDATP